MDAMIVTGQAAQLSAKDLLFLAQNPDKLDAVHKALEEKRDALKAEHAALADKLALVGKAEEIPNLHAEAQRLRAEAARAVDEAKQATDAAAADHRLAADRLKEAAHQNALLDDREAELARRQANLIRLEQAAADATERGRATEELFRAKAAKVNSILGAA